MTGKNVEQQPSSTALFTALRRTLAWTYGDEKFGSDNLARYFLAPHFRFFLKFKKIRVNAWNKLANAFPGMNEYIIARTAWLDRLFVEALNNQTPQVVLLGAGYDTRAYRFAKLNRDTRVFELDIPPTQNRKIKCLKAAQIDLPSWVTFVPINFNQESLDDALEKAGCQPTLRTLLIWEGVSYYLDPGSVDATLAYVSHLAAGSLIAFDYTIPITAENQDTYYGTKVFVQTMQSYHANEKLTFSLDEDKIGAFLEQRDLKLVEHLDNEAIEKTFLLKADGTLLGRITGNFRFAAAAPVKK